MWLGQGRRPGNSDGPGNAAFPASNPETVQPGSSSGLLFINANCKHVLYLSHGRGVVLGLLGGTLSVKSRNPVWPSALKGPFCPSVVQNAVGRSPTNRPVQTFTSDNGFPSPLEPGQPNGQLC